MPVASLGTRPFALHCEGSVFETSQWHDFNEIHILRLYRGNTGTMADPFVFASLGLAVLNHLEIDSAANYPLPIFTTIHCYDVQKRYTYVVSRGQTLFRSVRNRVWPRETNTYVAF